MGGALIRVELPWPNPKLAPNRSNGNHWGGVSAIKAKAKNDAFLLTRQAMSGLDHYAPLQHLSLRLTLNAPDKRRRDVDGVLSSLKSALDGVALALGVDDHYFNPITLDYRMGNKPGSVTLEIL